MATPLIRNMFLLCFSVFAFMALASNGFAEESRIPEPVDPGLNYLLSLAEPVHSQNFDTGVIDDVIKFVLSSKDKNTLYFPGNRTNIASAYHEFDIHNGLKHVLDIGFNPNIPPFILSPSSIRLAYWTEINGKKQLLPDLSSMLSQLDKPVMVTGVEHEEITPDLNTGAYYGYDLNRTLILLKYQGCPVLISISKQKNISDIGKKGVVLGKDDNWDYFYSGQNGLNKPGLGWVNSYMYDSYTISIFIERGGAGSPLVHCGIFKWLRAGWADMNMVQNHHIYRGLQRYTDTVKGILEFPSLPAPDKMAEIFSRIKTFSTDELRDKVKNYITLLSQKYRNDSSSGVKLIAETTKDSTYLSQLNQHQMQSVLAVEYIKFLMGKNTIQDVAYFISPADINRDPKG
jgi:hypothetical protein